MIFSRSGLELSEISHQQAQLVEADERLRRLERARHESPEHAHRWYHAMRHAGRGDVAIGELQRHEGFRDKIAELFRKEGDHDTADHLTVAPHVHSWQDDHQSAEHEIREQNAGLRSIPRRVRASMASNLRNSRSYAEDAARYSLLRRDPASRPSREEARSHASKFLSGAKHLSFDNHHLIHQVVQWARGHDTGEADLTGRSAGQRSPNGNWYLGTLGSPDARDSRAKQIGDAVERLGIGKVTNISKSNNNHVLGIMPKKKVDNV